MRANKLGIIAIGAILFSGSVSAKNTIQECRDAVIKDVAERKGEVFTPEGTQIGYDREGKSYVIIMEGLLLGFSDHEQYRCDISQPKIKILAQR